MNGKDASAVQTARMRASVGIVTFSFSGSGGYSDGRVLPTSHPTELVKSVILDQWLNVFFPRLT